MNIKTKIAALAVAGALLGGAAVAATPAEPAQAYSRYCANVHKRVYIVPGLPGLGTQEYTWCYTTTNAWDRAIGIKSGWYWVPGNW